MGQYIVRRLLQSIIVIFGVTLLSFLTLHLAGDPTYFYVSERASEEEINETRIKLGFDKPLPVQYLNFLGNLARGDLGIECPLEDVPHLQKYIIRSCVEAGVPVITATQMLESMITAASPTRAEVTDVANAVFDGTDAVMLSGETAIGVDPALVIRTIVRIAARAEQEANYEQWGSRLGRVQRQSTLVPGPDRTTMALTHAAFQAAADIGVSAILCCTRSGRTATAMASFRPRARLLGLSPDPVTARALAVSWGVRPLVVDTYHTTDELVWFAVERAVQSGYVRAGEQVLVLAGAPDRRSGGATDVLRVVTVE